MTLSNYKCVFSIPFYDNRYPLNVSHWAFKFFIQPITYHVNYLLNEKLFSVIISSLACLTHLWPLQPELTCGPGFPRMPGNPGGPWTPCPMQTQHIKN